VTPGALPSTLLPTRRERDHGWAWLRVEGQRVPFRPLEPSARLACAPTSRASFCTTAWLVQPVTEGRAGGASIHGITAGEAPWRAPLEGSYRGCPDGGTAGALSDAAGMFGRSEGDLYVG